MPNQPLLGRDDALQAWKAEVVTAFARADGGLRIRGLLGPAGRGKTSFLRELHTRCAEEAFTPGVLTVDQKNDWKLWLGEIEGLPAREIKSDVFENWPEDVGCLVLADQPTWSKASTPHWITLIDSLNAQGVSCFVAIAGRTLSDIPTNWPGLARPILLPPQTLPPLEEEHMRAIAEQAGASELQADRLLPIVNGEPGLLLEEIARAQPKKPRSALYAAWETWWVLRSSDEQTALGVMVKLGQWCRDGLTWAGLKQITETQFRDVSRQLEQLVGALDPEGRFSRDFEHWLDARVSSSPNLDAKEAQIQRWRDVITEVPGEAARRELVRYADIAFFNAELVNELWGIPKATFEAWTETFSPYLQNTGHNYHLAPALQRPLALYAELVGVSQDAAVAPHLAEIWANQREKLTRQKGMLEKRIEEAEEEIKHLDGEIKILQRKRKRANQVQRFADRPRKPAMPAHVRTAGSMLLEVCGVGFLYFSILFADEFQPLPFALGIGCILTGLLGALWQGPAPAVALANSNRSTTPPPLTENETKILRLRAEQLSLRKADWAKRRATNRRELTAVAEQLEEPYLLDPS